MKNVFQEIPREGNAAYIPLYWQCMDKHTYNLWNKGIRHCKYLLVFYYILSSLFLDSYEEVELNFKGVNMWGFYQTNFVGFCHKSIIVFVKLSILCYTSKSTSVPAYLLSNKAFPTDLKNHSTIYTFYWKNWRPWINRDTKLAIISSLFETLHKKTKQIFAFQ